MREKRICRYIARITVFVMIFTAFAAFAGTGDFDSYAASEVKINQKGTITDGPLNVRSGPGTKYSKIGKLSKGKTITVLTKKTDSKGDSWYKFKYSSSKYGYVSAEYVKLKKADKTINFVRKGVVKPSSLNVRSGSATSYSKLGSLKKGTAIYIKKKVTKASGDVWYQFTYNGKTAYVNGNSKYVTLTDIVSETKVNQKAVITDGPLNVRSGPGTKYSKLGKVEKGKNVQVVQQIKKTDGSVWYKYKFSSSKYGYLSAEYIKLINENDVKTETAFEKQGVVKCSSLNVRAGASADSKLLGKLKQNDTISIEKKIELYSGEIWYQFDYNGKTGYVNGDSEYITIGKKEISPVVFDMGTVTTDPGYSLNVRSGAGTEYSKIGEIPSGTVVVVLGSKKASNGKVWYKYQFSSSKTGWICSDYVDVEEVTSTSEFEEYMDGQGFPESYKPALRMLKASHPEWVFKAYDVGCSWDTAVSKENAKPGINVVSSSSPKSYRSKDKDCYNKKTGVWSRYDGGWYSAHTDVIRYYMDPRNALNENGIYQFLTHKYDSATQNASTVKAVVKGTFMETRVPKTDYKSFATLINAAGKNSGVSPNVLAAMIIQEQGVKGSSGSISGTVKKYEGYYNFLNVGAWTTSTMTAVQRGLWYAKEEGWDSEYKAILGGAKIYNNNYIEKNQYTFYTKKFNVMNGTSKIGVHQYMTNVQGAYGEGVQLKKAFPANYNGALTFIIPVYDSMPDNPCNLP